MVRRIKIQPCGATAEFLEVGRRVPGAIRASERLQRRTELARMKMECDILGKATLASLSLSYWSGDREQALSRHTVTYAGVHFLTLHPAQLGLRHTANLRRYRIHCSPQRGILAAVFLHQPHRTFTHFRGKLVRLVHGSIFAKNGPSSNPGAIRSG